MRMRAHATGQYINEGFGHRGGFPWIPPPRGGGRSASPEYFHEPVHEEWQVCNAPHLSTESFHLGVE